MPVGGEGAEWDMNGKVGTCRMQIMQGGVSVWDMAGWVLSHAYLLTFLLDSP